MSKHVEEERESTLPIGTVVAVTKHGDTYLAMLPDGTDVTQSFVPYQLRNAVLEERALKRMLMPSGKLQWRKVDISEFNEHVRSHASDTPSNSDKSDHDTLVKFIANSAVFRPSTYKMNDLKWKFAIRTVLRGKNMMITGPKGTGKTVLAFTLRDVLNRPFFNIPLGASQDPRSTLIGNVHFKAEHGTFVGESLFIQAIQTPNAIILLDEITRAHPDAWNILMSALDYKQRFVRIDEAHNVPTIMVADGVTFVATANIGSQYTATRTLDAALRDRFITVEVDYLTRAEETDLLMDRVKGLDAAVVKAIVGVAADLRRDAIGSSAKVAEGLSTRSTIEMAELIFDGFSFLEAVELVVYPQYHDAGGSDSERAYVKQLVQKHIPVEKGNTKAPFNLDPLGNEDDKLPWTPVKP